MQLNSPKKSKKIAIFHHFFKGDCKGGGEKLILQIRNYYQAPMYTGGIDLEVWGKEQAQEDSFVSRLWQDNLPVKWLHLESKNKIWSRIKRQLFLAFSPITKELKEYDYIIFSGNIGFLPRRMYKKGPKLIAYLHTPPRPITDQLESNLQKLSPILRPIAKFGARLLQRQYKNDMQKMDAVVANSENTASRITKYIGLSPSHVIWPAVETDKFKYISQGDFFLSFARLEKAKRIDLVLEAFANMPDKKLVVCSTGPLKDWLINQIKVRKLDNIIYEGLVSDQRLRKLVGTCLAGVYIPVNEDAGMTQCEIMSAGKPVIGVKEGGLLATVIDNKTGLLINQNPKVEDLIRAVQSMTPEKAKSMKEACQKQAEQFSEEIFFRKLDQVITDV